MEIWTLNDGVNLIRAIRTDAAGKYGYNVLLGGSVLNHGRSENDLDLFFTPLEQFSKADPTGLVKWLTELWGIPREDNGTGYFAPANRGVRVGGILNRNRAQNNPLFPPPGRLLVRDEDEDDLDPEPEPVPLKRQNSIYEKRLVFTRPDGHIEVFVIEGKN